jgi:uncharacterized membrane protein YhhN
VFLFFVSHCLYCFIAHNLHDQRGHLSVLALLTGPLSFAPSLTQRLAVQDPVIAFIVFIARSGQAQSSKKNQKQLEALREKKNRMGRLERTK